VLFAGSKGSDVAGARGVAFGLAGATTTAREGLGAGVSTGVAEAVGEAPGLLESRLAVRAKGAYVPPVVIVATTSELSVMVVGRGVQTPERNTASW
jgi:hypothetical protein